MIIIPERGATIPGNNYYPGVQTTIPDTGAVSAGTNAHLPELVSAAESKGKLLAKSLSLVFNSLETIGEKV